MVAGYKIALGLLYAASTIAQTVTNGKNFVDGKQCCPGPVVKGTNGDACCVLDGTCKQPCFNPKCKAKIDIDDSNYQKKLDEAMGASASASPSESASATSSADSGSSSGSASGSGTASENSSMPASSAATTSAGFRLSASAWLSALGLPMAVLVATV